MGETSKKLGEQGEKTVRDFFASIGWLALADGFDIDCENPKKHKHESSESGRQTHGIDFAFSYVCPIVTDRRRNILISAKNSGDDETKTRRALVKNDIQDLATALACFKRSPQKKLMIGGGEGAKSSDDMGILIRINKDKNAERSHLGDIGHRERIEIEGACPIYLIENLRFDLVEKIMQHVSSDFKGMNHSFALPKTALNFAADSRRTSCPMLPVQSLIAGPLVVRLDPIIGGSNPSLAIYSDDLFNVERLRRLISLALDMSSNWVDVTIIFPDFQQNLHSDLANQALAGMAQKDFAGRIKCASLETRSRIK